MIRRRIVKSLRHCADRLGARVLPHGGRWGATVGRVCCIALSHAAPCMDQAPKISAEGQVLRRGTHLNRFALDLQAGGFQDGSECLDGRVSAGRQGAVKGFAR